MVSADNTLVVFPGGSQGVGLDKGSLRGGSNDWRSLPFWPLCLICYNPGTQIIVKVTYIACLWQVQTLPLQVTSLDAWGPVEQAWYTHPGQARVTVTPLIQDQMMACILLGGQDLLLLVPLKNLSYHP